MNAKTEKLNWLDFLRSLFIIFLLPQIAHSQVIVPETVSKSRVVISPYAQAVPNDSYTFISVSHPSLDSAQTQIGVGLEVIGMTTVPDNAAGRAAIFTIDAGTTHRIFVANLSHSTVNSSIESSTTHLILTADSAQFGNVRAVGIHEDPANSVVVNNVRKFNNLSQLDFWGVVFIESSGTGFSMEFIGDAHDSTIGRNYDSSIMDGTTGVSTGITRGIN
ncbi:MAG: hypothetical protein F3743_04780 [Nitrospinae bacterium]|nr:hypothetical protein [Nitrospinota bacterium]MZH04699.1 hypothetical protein [Nitrospinota bacterium]MZH14603.1 hypothetical protein [Nitrospinota bacterium]